MSDKIIYSTGGYSLATVLGLIFIVLKLCGVIDWSWLWILSPFWISFGLGMFVCLVCLLILGLLTLIKYGGDRK